MDLTVDQGWQAALTRIAKDAAWLILAIVVMQYLHELGHALVAKTLGYDVVMTVNKVHSSGASQAAPATHSQLIAIAGPAATILLSALAFLARHRIGELSLIITFNAMMMRIIAAIISLVNPNDEAWVSASLGIGMWTIPLISCSVLLALFAPVWKEHRPTWTWYVAMWIGLSIGYSAVVMGEQLFPRFAF